MQVRGPSKAPAHQGGLSHARTVTCSRVGFRGQQVSSGCHPRVVLLLQHTSPADSHPPRVWGAQMGPGSRQGHV